MKDPDATLHVGSWGHFAGYSTVEQTVEDFLCEFTSDYDVTRLTDAYRTAINTALDRTTIGLHGQEFYSGNPMPDDAANLIRAAIESVDLGALAAQHEKDRSRP